MVSEITISIKDEEKTLKKKFLIYDSFAVSEDDPIIKSCIEETVSDFNTKPDQIKVRINLTLE